VLSNINEANEHDQVSE
jgi:colicin import membrane protein